MPKIIIKSFAASFLISLTACQQESNTRDATPRSEERVAPLEKSAELSLAGASSPIPQVIEGAAEISIQFPGRIQRDRKFFHIHVAKAGKTHLFAAPIHVDDNKLVVSSMHLPPSTDYILHIPGSAISVDGSGPNEPLDIPFTTASGPEPLKIKLGTGGLTPLATATAHWGHKSKIRSGTDLVKLGREKHSDPDDALSTQHLGVISELTGTATQHVGAQFGLTGTTLTDDQVYADVFLGLYHYGPGFTIDGADMNQVLAQMALVFDHHPYFFNGPASFHVSSNGSTVTAIYDIDMPTWTKIKQAFAQSVRVGNFLVAQGGPSVTVDTYLQSAHDWIVNNTSYDLRYYSGNIPPDSYGAYGVFYNRTAVCTGYSAAMELLSALVGIPTMSVSGSGLSNTQVSKKDHKWNKILSNLFIDATWDDPVMPDHSQVLREDYYLKYPNVMAQDHIWNDNAYPQKYEITLNNVP